MVFHSIYVIEPSMKNNGFVPLLTVASSILLSSPLAVAQIEPHKNVKVINTEFSPKPNFEVLQYRGPYRSLEALQKNNDYSSKVISCKGLHCIKDQFLIKLKHSHTSDLLTLQSHFTGLQIEQLIDVDNNAINALDIGAEQVRAYQQLERWYRVSISDISKRDSLIEQLAQRDEVAFIEELQIRSLNENSHKTVEANDPRLAEQWHLENAKVDQAWQWLADNGYSSGGDSDIVVAVIDSGVDYSHSDLSLNMWVNHGEIANDGIDNDGNGFIDDIHGASVLGSSYDHRGEMMDDHGHGTHVAGIIASRRNNNLGGSGVAPNIKIMGVKAAQYTGLLTSADIAEGIYYAVEQGADIINMSFGGTSKSLVEEDALAVAFGQAVLIAAAGNSGLPNDTKCAVPKDAWERSYPAAYSWVVGVQAHDIRDRHASFSNWDCIPDDPYEYEISAPGVDILSTLPNEGYASWDGTSMAAPVAAGTAALIRTRFDDKSIYSSRFVMGQLAINDSLDALAAITESPAPKLSYLEHYLWDEVTDSPANNDNGKVDAGEQIDLAVVVRNQWGQADNVQVSISAQVGGASGKDPYIEWVTDTVNYGSVGTFANDDNGLIYNDEGLVTGVETPFTFKVADNTPNNHIINFKVSFSAQNGLDPDDGENYQFTSEFQMQVNKGIYLPSILASDAPGTDGGNLDSDGVVDNVITLDDKALYIIDKPVLIPEGMTLKLQPGVQVQFWGSQADDTYPVFQNSYLQVEGNFTIAGSQEKPVSLFPSDLFPYRAVVLRYKENGKVDIDYANLSNLYINTGSYNNPNTINGNRIDVSLTHVRLDKLVEGNDSYIYFSKVKDNSWERSPSLIIPTGIIEKSIIYGLGKESEVRAERPVQSIGDGWVLELEDSFTLKGNMNQVLVENSYFNKFFGQSSSIDDTISNSVFLGNNKLKDSRIKVGSSILADLRLLSESVTVDAQFTNNAILDRWWNPDPSQWLQFKSRENSNKTNHNSVLNQNYWSTTSDEIVDYSIFDYKDDFNLYPIVANERLETVPETAYPFVVDVALLDADGNVRPGNKFSAEPMTWKIHFNRDMDTSVQPRVNYGPDYPYTDFSVSGNWIDARTWQGTTTISPVATSGYQYVNVQGAVAADDAWLVTGKDYARYRFEVDANGLNTMSLQASAGEGFVDLTWSFDDFDTLYGFNLYRSTSENGNFTRINQSLVDNNSRSYKDTNVEPGVDYFYQFRIASGDGESEPSNTASATPVDTIKPVISHSPVNAAGYGANVLIKADVTDNIEVKTATLYYRQQGDSEYVRLTMLNQQGSEYKATIPGSVVQTPGVDYYIEATDGASYSYSGRTGTPHEILVTDAPSINLVSPNSGPATGGTKLTISGNNFKDGFGVMLGATVCEQPEWINKTEITCISGSHYPATVDVIVTNPDEQSARSPAAFTYLSDSSNVGMGNFEAGFGQTLDVPVRIDNANGLKAFELTLNYNPTVLKLENIRKGGLISSWSMSDNEAEQGKVKVVAASSGAIASGDGDILMLEFTVIATTEVTSKLSIEEIELNDGAISAQVYDGQVAVIAGYTISGIVQHWSDFAAMDRVNLLLDDGISQNKSNSEGYFSFAGVRSGEHNLRAEKETASGDMITAYDASLMLQHIAGSQPLTSYAFQAADLNANNDISAMEVNAVLEKAVGVIGLPLPNTQGVWGFNPADYQYENLQQDLTQQNFIGYLLGDPSGNALDKAQTYSSTWLSWFNRRELENGLIAVDLYLSDKSRSVTAMDLTIEYDSNHVDIAMIDTAELLSDWLIVRNDNEQGIVKVSTASAEPVTNDGRLLTVVMVPRSGVVTDLRVVKALLNEGVSSIAPIAVMPKASDVDNDGLPDVWELEHGFDPFSDSDANQDSDNDGLTNLEEYLLDTDPFNQDSDDDGVKDGDDAFPKNGNEHSDNDGDGIGDKSDSDIDGDSVANFVDPAPYDASDRRYQQFLNNGINGHYLAASESSTILLNSASEVIVQGKSIGIPSLDDELRTISQSKGHLLVVDNKGQIWSAGDNEHGQLGLGDTLGRSELSLIMSDTIWVQVYASSHFSVALDQDGTLWGWGQLPFSELIESSPVIVDDTQHWVRATVGVSNILLINEHGQLYSYESAEPSDRFTLVTEESDWVAISAGKAHSLALKNDGTLWAWGKNSKGQLGLGHFDSVPIPTQVGSSTDWIKIEAAGETSLALSQSHQVWLWGDNLQGQLGHFDDVLSEVPLLLDSEQQWQVVSLSPFNAVGVTINGEIWGWGDNTNYQLSDQLGNSVLPQQIISDVQIATDTDDDGIVDFSDPNSTDPTLGWNYVLETPSTPGGGSSSGGGSMNFWVFFLMSTLYLLRRKNQKYSLLT